DAVPAVLPAEPIALEAMDDKLVRLEKEKHLNPKAVKLLPDAGGYLMVQMGGETREQVDASADHMLSLLGKDRDDKNVVFFDDPEHEAEVWRGGDSGLRAAGRHPGFTDAWPGGGGPGVPPGP